MKNHFELLDLPVTFDIDSAELDRAYRNVLAQVHPDRHAGGGEVERRVAMQWATAANEAYRTLRSPVKRAAYLLELIGHPLELERNTAMEESFLLAQLEWREAVDEARSAADAAALEQLASHLRRERVARIDTLSGLFQLERYGDAAATVRELSFLDKLEQEIGDSLIALNNS